MAKPFVTPAAIVVTENYIVMLIYDENSQPPFVTACQVLNANGPVIAFLFEPRMGQLPCIRLPCPLSILRPLRIRKLPVTLNM